MEYIVVSYCGEKKNSNKQLKYTLNSIFKHLKGEYEVYLIGKHNLFESNPNITFIHNPEPIYDSDNEFGAHNTNFLLASKMFKSFYPVICGNIFLKDIDIKKIQTVCFDNSILKFDLDLISLVNYMKIEFKIRTSKKSFICAPNLIHKLERDKIEKLIKKIPSLRTKYYPLVFFYVNYYKKNIKRVLKPNINTDIIETPNFYPAMEYIKQKDYIYLSKEAAKENVFCEVKFSDFV